MADKFAIEIGNKRFNLICPDGTKQDFLNAWSGVGFPMADRWTPTITVEGEQVPNPVTQEQFVVKKIRDMLV